MFKRVEDDVLLGVSKVITKNNNETGTLLIDEAKLSEDKIEESDDIKTYTLEDLINITNDNEELIRNIIEKKDGIKSKKEQLIDEEDLVETSDEDSSDNESVKSNEVVHRDEYNEMKEELLSSLKEHIGYLKDQIDTKDKQLQNKDELIRNFQVLMKSDKDRIHELETAKAETEVEEEIVSSSVELNDSTDDVNSVDSVDEIEESHQSNETSTKKRGLLSWFRK